MYCWNIRNAYSKIMKIRYIICSYSQRGDLQRPLCFFAADTLPPSTKPTKAHSIYHTFICFDSWRLLALTSLQDKSHTKMTYMYVYQINRESKILTYNTTYNISVYNTVHVSQYWYLTKS